MRVSVVRSVEAPAPSRRIRLRRGARRTDDASETQVARSRVDELHHARRRSMVLAVVRRGTNHLSSRAAGCAASKRADRSCLRPRLRANSQSCSTPASGCRAPGTSPSSIPRRSRPSRTTRSHSGQTADRCSPRSRPARGFAQETCPARCSPDAGPLVVNSSPHTYARLRARRAPRIPTHSSTSTFDADCRGRPGDRSGEQTTDDGTGSSESDARYCRIGMSSARIPERSLRPSVRVMRSTESRGRGIESRPPASLKSSEVERHDGDRSALPTEAIIVR